MTLPTSGAISLANVNTEAGRGVVAVGLDWVRSNTYYGYKDLNSIRGKIWFQAVSSKNSCSRTEGGTTTNCTANCAAQTSNCIMFDGAVHDINYIRANNCSYGDPFRNCLINCAAAYAVNCNQCGYGHGTYLQANCNCNCNCYVCNCNYVNCVCTTDCNCGGGD